MIVALSLSMIATLLYFTCYGLSSWKLPPKVSLWSDPLPLSVLKPVRGLDHDAEANFRSFFLQRYPAPWELIFALESPDDPALPLLRHLSAEHPDVVVRIVFSSLQHEWTGKMANVIAAYRYAKHPLIVISDSDMQVPEDFLLRMVSPLQDRRVGLVGALPVYTAAKSLWARALLVYAHLFGLCFAGTMTSVQVPGKFAAGNQAIRREVLQKIGGFEAIAGYISEDLRLGQLVAEQELRIVYSAMAIAPVGDINYRELVQVLLRYQLASRALSLPLYIFTGFLAIGHWMLLLWLGVYSWHTWWALVLAAMPLLARAFVAWRLHERWAGAVSFFTVFVAAVVLDWAFLVAAARTWSSPTICWRHVGYRVLADGRVQRLPWAGSGNQSQRI